MLKPFKAPSFLTRSDATKGPKDIEPLAKRRRTDSGESGRAEVPNASAIQRSKGSSSTSNGFRKPLTPLLNISDSQAVDPGAFYNDAYYNVLWRKFTTKKNKTWESDGILRISGGLASLQDMSGKELGRSPHSGGPLLPGSGLKLSGRDVEVESVLSRKDYLAERPLLAAATAVPVVIKDGDESDGNDQQSRKKYGSGFVAPKSRVHCQSVPSGWKSPPTLAVSSDFEGEKPTKPLNFAASQSVASRGKWKNPLKDNTILPKVDSVIPTPRHDTTGPDAVVMKRPSLKDIPKSKQLVDVVVDPLLSRKLRDHQKEGVKFLYDCVMGMRTNVGQGAILADDMGLGKTLQTIALIWTLLKQNPIYEAEPIIRKALIVCPVTLIKNWRKEFRKWLGFERIGVLAAEDPKTRITDFTKGRSYSVLIIGYERLRSVHEELQKGHGIDLIVADEGHRLKTAQSKSAQAIQSLNTPRRIILSGTPVQNNLSEFFSMVDFVNPGALGTAKAFTRNFEKPIEKSRQPDATEKDVEKGDGRGEELADITNTFILRRTADILSKYLPPKTESILLCKPTGAQAAVYKHVLSSPVFQSALGSSENALQLITILKKVCNSPRLLSTEPAKDPERVGLAPDIAASIPAQLLRNASSSAKLRTLDNLLSTIQRTTSEKVVIVSNFTSTLDVIGQLLSSLSMTFLRLDGTTPTSKRQDLVDTFNNSDNKRNFAFLLSAKAGGMGINLIGASRLILFDIDWNPAVDAQAMARIHRDGQKRPCHIYRLLLGGALDEKIWQRQVTKLGLATSVLESKSGKASFSKEELKDLFRLDEGMRCQTHELIGCSCGGRGQATAEFHKDECSKAEDDQDENEDDRSSKELIEISSDEEVSDSTDDEDEDILPVRSMHRQHKRVPAKPELETKPKIDSLDDKLGLMKASELDVELQERLIRERREAARKAKLDASKEMESLMGYSHIDTALLQEMPAERAEELIADDVLNEAIRDEENLITFVFSKTTS